MLSLQYCAPGMKLFRTPSLVRFLVVCLASSVRLELKSDSLRWVLVEECRVQSMLSFLGYQKTLRPWSHKLYTLRVQGLGSRVSWQDSRLPNQAVHARDDLRLPPFVLLHRLPSEKKLGPKHSPQKDPLNFSQEIPIPP